MYKLSVADEKPTRHGKPKRNRRFFIKHRIENTKWRRSCRGTFDTFLRCAARPPRLQSRHGRSAGAPRGFHRH